MKPDAPLTSTLAIQKSRLHARELVDRLLVVVDAPDIEPVSGVRAHVHVRMRLQQIAHQIVEAVGPPGRQVGEDSPTDHVDAHADLIGRDRLFPKALQGAARRREHAVVDAMRTAM